MSALYDIGVWLVLVVWTVAVFIAGVSVANGYWSDTVKQVQATNRRLQERLREVGSNDIR